MFWMRRVLRIFPLYYLFLVLGTLTTFALFRGTSWVPTLSYWLYLQNYTLAFDTEVMRWTAHFWSLAIEEQFYFVWPVVALVVPRRKLLTASAALIGCVIALRAVLVFRGLQFSELAALLHDSHGIAKFVYRATFTRADGLLLGAFAALAQREAHSPMAVAWRRLRYSLFLGSSVFIAALYVFANGLNDYDRRVMVVGYAMLSLFFATAIGMCADGDVNARVARILCSRPLVACGKVSYGMYIVHWPIVVVLVPRLERLQASMSIQMQLAVTSLVIVACIVATYGVAVVCFRFIESPFLRLKHRFHD